jgi:amidase
VLADEALAAAESPDLPDGPFRGVPLLLKDLAVRQVGVPHWQGVPALRAAGIRARQDSLIGARLRHAGFVTVGTTTTCQLGWGLAASPMGFDAVSNPWDLERSPGGSSGGSGAAVAGGMVPIATATDAGGSARIPASWCGLVGLKVSRGLVPSNIVAPPVAEGAITRTVRDTAAVLDVLAASAPGALWAAPGAPTGGWAGQVGIDPGRLRIGLLAELLPDTDADTRQALEEAGRVLIELGHDVEAGQPAALFEEVPERLGRTSLALLTLLLNQAETDLGRPLNEQELEPDNWAMAISGREIRAVDALELAALDQAWAMRVAQWWQNFDLLVLPTCPVVAQPLSIWRQDPADPWAHRPRWNGAGAYAGLFNRSGQPAISVPLHWTAEGLPVGIQFVAAHGRDGLLLQVAAQLEQVRPWHARRPAVFA